MTDEEIKARLNKYKETSQKRVVANDLKRNSPQTFQITAESNPDIWAKLQPPND